MGTALVFRPDDVIAIRMPNANSCVVGNSGELTIFLNGGDAVYIASGFWREVRYTEKEDK